MTAIRLLLCRLRGLFARSEGAQERARLSLARRSELIPKKKAPFKRRSRITSAVNATIGLTSDQLRLPNEWEGDKELHDLLDVLLASGRRDEIERFIRFQYDQISGGKFKSG
jgi:hypothetical protein